MLKQGDLCFLNVSRFFFENLNICSYSLRSLKLGKLMGKTKIS
jgi:hypothetical protein